jgi:xylan 1,4-beta-xylosidase
MIHLQQSYMVNAVQVNFAEEGTQLLGRSGDIYYQYLLEYSNDKKTWKTIADKTTTKTDVVHDYLQLKTPVSARYIRLTNYHVPDGKFAVSGLRVFGKGNGTPPARLRSFEVKRDSSDARDAKLAWQKIPGAVGYNIRFGTRPDKLYENYQVFDTDTLTIHSLNRLKPYYFTIDAFNENGISNGKTIIKKWLKQL